MDVLIFPGRILRQVPVPYQCPGRTKDRQPRPSAPAPDQHPPGYASIKIQTCCCQVSADQHRARYPNQGVEQAATPARPVTPRGCRAVSHI